MWGNFFCLSFFIPFVVSKLSYENAPLKFGKQSPVVVHETESGAGQSSQIITPENREQEQAITPENREQEQAITSENREQEPFIRESPEELEKEGTKDVATKSYVPSLKEILIKAAEHGASGLSSVASGLGAVALHPLNTSTNIIKQSQNAMSGGFLGIGLMESDPILDPSIRASKKKNLHLLNDSIDLPGDQQFPPRINTVNGYPNPLTDPLPCHRRGRSRSYVCDPDDVLGHSKAEAIEEVLEEVRRRCVHPCGATFTDEENEAKTTEVKLVPCTMVVAVTRTIPDNATGDSMATDLLRRFNIGQKECQDGVLMLYSDSNQEVYIRWNKGEENRLNENSYASLQSVLHHVFRSSALDDAFTQTIALIDMQQSGKMPQPRHPAHFWFLLTAFGSVGLMFLGFFVVSIPRAKPEDSDIGEDAPLLQDSAESGRQTSPVAEE